MNLDLVVTLLKVLSESIESRDGRRQGHPSSRFVRERAQTIAEREAIRHLRATASFMDSLVIGLEAYAREMRYFSPLSLVHESENVVDISGRLAVNN